MKYYTLSEIKKIKDEGNYYDLKWKEGESDGIISFEFGKSERFIIV